MILSLRYIFAWVFGRVQWGCKGNAPGLSVHFYLFWCDPDRAPRMNLFCYRLLVWYRRNEDIVSFYASNDQSIRLQLYWSVLSYFLFLASHRTWNLNFGARHCILIYSFNDRWRREFKFVATNLLNAEGIWSYELRGPHRASSDGIRKKNYLQSMSSVWKLIV